MTLKEAMAKMKLTTSDLSLKSGIDYSRIISIGIWDSIPNEEEKKSIAEALGIGISDLNWPELKRANGVIEDDLHKM